MFRTHIAFNRPLPTTLQYQEPLLSLLRFSTRRFRYIHGNGLAVLIDSVGQLGDSFSCDYMLLPTIEALHEMGGVGVARCFRGFASAGLADDMLRKHFLKNYLRRQRLTVSTLSIFAEGLSKGFEHAISDFAAHGEQVHHHSIASNALDKSFTRVKRAMSTEVARERAKYLDSMQMLLIAAHRQCLSESRDSFFLPEEADETLLLSEVGEPSLPLGVHATLSATLALLHGLPQELFGHPSTDYIIDVLLEAVNQSTVVSLAQLLELSDAIMVELSPRLQEKLRQVIAPRILQPINISIIRNSPSFLLSILSAFAPGALNEQKTDGTAQENTTGVDRSLIINRKIFLFFSDVAKRFYLDYCGESRDAARKGSCLEFVGMLSKCKLLPWMPDLAVEVMKQASLIVQAELSSRQMASSNLSIFIENCKGAARQDTNILHIHSWQLSEYIEIVEILVHLVTQPEPRGDGDSAPEQSAIDPKWVQDLLFAALNLIERLLWEEPLGVGMLLRLVGCLHELAVTRHEEVDRNRKRRVQLMTAGDGREATTKASGAADGGEADGSMAQPKARTLNYKLIASVDQSISRAIRNLQLWEAVELFALHVRYAPSGRGTHSLAQKIIAEGAKLHGEEVGKLIRASKHYPLASNFMEKLIPHLKPPLIHSMHHMDVVCLLTQFANIFGQSTRRGDPREEEDTLAMKARPEVNPLLGSELEGTLKQFVALHVAELEPLPALSCLLAAGLLRLGFSSALTDQGSLIFDVLQGKLVPAPKSLLELTATPQTSQTEMNEKRRLRSSRGKGKGTGKGRGKGKGKIIERHRTHSDETGDAFHDGNEPLASRGANWFSSSTTTVELSVLEMAVRETTAISAEIGTPQSLPSLSDGQHFSGTFGAVVDIRFIQLIHQELHRLITRVPPPSLHLVVRVTASLSSSHIPRRSLLLLLRTIAARTKNRVRQPQGEARHSNRDARGSEVVVCSSATGSIFPSLEAIQTPTDLLALFLDLVQILSVATDPTGECTANPVDPEEEGIPFSVFSYLSVLVTRLGDLAKAQELKVEPLLEIYEGLLRAQNIWLTQSWHNEVTSPIEQCMQPFLKNILAVAVQFPQRWSADNLIKGFQLLLIDAKLNTANAMVSHQQEGGISPSSSAFVESRMLMLNALTYLTFYSLKLGRFRSSTAASSNVSRKSRNISDDDSLTQKQIQHLKESILPELVALGLPEAQRLLNVLRTENRLEQKLADILDLASEERNTTSAENTGEH